jgi:Tfp pilus assembly protein PilV
MRVAETGFGLVEVIVATLVLGMIALGVTHTLLVSQATRRAASVWLRAGQLAQQRMERIRAGATPDQIITDSGFIVASSSASVGAVEGLVRIEVTVTWDSPSPGRFVLSALMRDR